MKLVQLKGKTYAVDLWWQVRSGGPAKRKEMLRMARETADMLKKSDGSCYTCVAVRTEQYGLGICTLPVPTLHSLAASIRPPAQSFIGVFHFSEGWWVCGISQGTVAATGDCLLATEGEARQHAAKLRGLFGTCQEELCLTETESAAFLVPLLSPEARLERLYIDQQQVRRVIALGLGCAALAATLFGVKHFFDARQNEVAIQMARQFMQSKEARRQEILADPGQYFTPVWLEKPLASDKADQCLPAMHQTAAASNGWHLESVNCSGSGAGARLKIVRQHRPGANYVSLPLNAVFENREGNINSKKVISSQSLPPISDSRPVIPLLSRSKASGQLYQLTQSVGAKLRLSWGAPEKKTVGEVEVSAPWQTGTWEYTELPAVLLLSGDFFALLQAIPGLGLEEIAFDNATNKWKLRGFVYALVR